MTIEWKSTLEKNTDNVDAKSIKDLDAAELKDPNLLKDIQDPQSKEKKDVICKEALEAEKTYIKYLKEGNRRGEDISLHSIDGMYISDGNSSWRNSSMSKFNSLACSTKDWLNGLIYLYNKYDDADIKSSLQNAFKKNPFTETLDIELLPISVLNVLANYNSAALQKAITLTANSGNEWDAKEILEVLSKKVSPSAKISDKLNTMGILRSISNWPFDKTGSIWLEIAATSGDLDALTSLGILRYCWNIAAKEALSNLRIDNLLNTIFRTGGKAMQFLYDIVDSNTVNGNAVVNKLKFLIEEKGLLKALNSLLSLKKTPATDEALKTFNPEKFINFFEEGKRGRDEYERLWLLNAYDPPKCPVIEAALKKINIEKVQKCAEQGNIGSLNLVVSIMDDDKFAAYIKNAIVSTLDTEALERFADYGNKIALSKLDMLAKRGDKRAIELLKSYEKRKLENK